MPGLIETLQNLPEPKEKKFFVTVQGKEYEVSLEKKKWTLQQGEDNLIVKNGEIVLKPKPKPKTQYSVLRQAQKGFVFQDDDIHWPTGIQKGGKIWLIEQE